MKKTFIILFLLSSNYSFLYAQCCANGPNLLAKYNPHFSDPIPAGGVPPGFQTDNTFNNNQAGSGYYLISTSRNYGACSRAPQYDHTSGDGQGKFLWFDTPGWASPANPATAWRPYDPGKPAGTENLIDVTPHTDYVFSVWIRDIARNADCVSGGAPVMGLRINGVDLAEIDLGIYTSPCCPEWIFLCTPWNSGDSVTARIQVESRSAQGFTDLAIDDVYFGTSTFPDVDGILGKDTTLCLGDTLTLHSPFPNTVWNGTVTGTSFQVTSLGTYWIHVDDNNCYGSDTIVISEGVAPGYFTLGNDTTVCNAADLLLQPKPVPASGTYLWSDNSTNHSLAVNDAGHYWLTVKNGCGIASDSIHIGKQMVDVSSRLKLIESCSNTSNGGAYIESSAADTNEYSFTWTDKEGRVLSTTDTLNDVPGGEYILTVRSEFCDTVLRFQLETIDYEASFIMDSLVCEGDPVSFQNTSNSYFTNFIWYFGDGDSSQLKDPDHAYEPGNYTVLLLARGEKCQDTATRQIGVEKDIDSLRLIKDKDSICVGETVVFTLLDADALGKTLNWGLGDGTSLSTRNPVIRHAYDQAGLMTISVMTTQKVCPDLMTVETVEVNPVPNVDLGAGAAICLNGNPIMLSNVNSHQPGYRYLWNTGDTTQQLQVRSPGIYSLKVISDKACASSEHIEVKKGCYIDIPNAFTPNGDGSNDYFFPRQLLSRDITKFNMSIYNRWGEKIFETTSLSGRGWDGKFNGKDVPVGVYVYTIDIEIDGAIAEQYDGNVTLIR